MPENHDVHDVHDVQELTDDEATVYEVAAALAVDDRPATVEAVAELAGMPQDDVRHCLEKLSDAGWLVPKDSRDGRVFALGRHDWGLEY